MKTKRLVRLSVNKAVLLQNNIFLHNNALTPTDMRQHYLRGLPFLVSKIYHFEVRCSFVAIKILLCRSWETKQGCRLARLSDKGIMKFYARNQYFLINTQPRRSCFDCLFSATAFGYRNSFTAIAVNKSLNKAHARRHNQPCGKRSDSRKEFKLKCRKGTVFYQKRKNGS